MCATAFFLHRARLSPLMSVRREGGHNFRSRRGLSLSLYRKKRSRSCLTSSHTCTSVCCFFFFDRQKFLTDLHDECKQNGRAQTFCNGHRIVVTRSPPLCRIIGGGGRRVIVQVAYGVVNRSGVMTPLRRHCVLKIDLQVAV